MAKIIDSVVDAVERCEDSNLNRIRTWIDTKEIAALTAWRDTLNDVENPSRTLIDKPLDGSPEDRKYSKEENRKRNKMLAQALMSKGYGITKVMGSYIEGESMPVTEESYFVVNLKDDPKFKDTISKLSEWFNQDSFLYKPKGESDAYLVGMNASEFPSYGNEVKVGPFLNNVASTYATRIKNESFSFGERETNKPFRNRPFSENKKHRMSDSALEGILVEDSIYKHGHLTGMGLQQVILKNIKEGKLPKM